MLWVHHNVISPSYIACSIFALASATWHISKSSHPRTSIFSSHTTYSASVGQRRTATSSLEQQIGHSTIIMDTLASRLGDAAISQLPIRNGEHEVSLTYPALHYLPEDTKAFMRASYMYRHREQPQIENAVADQGSSFDYTFSYIVKDAVVPSPYPETSDAGGLHDAIDRLSEVTGHTLISIVSFKTYTGNKMWKFVIETAQQNGSFEQQALRIDSLDSIWDFPTTHETSQDLLEDLVDCFSERAFFHVERRIAPSINEVGQSRCREWNTAAFPRSANHILALKFQTPVINEHGSVSRVPGMNLDEEELADRTQQWILPCNCICLLETSYVRSLSPNGCFRFRCNKCGQLLLSRRQADIIMFMEDRVKRRNLHRLRHAWVKLDLQPIHLNSTLHLNGEGPFKALGLAWASLRVPETVAPSQLMLPECPESRLAVYVVQQALKFDPPEGEFTVETNFAGSRSQNKESLRWHAERLPAGHYQSWMGSILPALASAWL
ncbi:hypothetical protein K431DRAFT_116525 [Polychaeton citri CBS 116435]|uniref:Uncharacterized protein n=1 Tax=Polychaeton citri CBS 116435 TaxID=1314669 RepID=A0A9P4QHI4_9PEZI|nr:hypothetical protein K431DRAFT_116525 [Polychaeton citri CBS 116435]